MTPNITVHAALCRDRRQFQPDTQSASFAVGEFDVATMLVNDRTSNRQPEPDTACVAVAGAFQPAKWLENLVTFAPRNASSSIMLTTNSDSGTRLTSAFWPYFTALSKSLETARRNAAGRQWIVMPRGPEKLTSWPLPAASSRIPSISAHQRIPPEAFNREA